MDEREKNLELPADAEQDEQTDAAQEQASEDAASAPEPPARQKIKMTPRQWLENFWYHHKFGTIAGLIALITVVVCTVQMCGRTEPDLHVMYCGSEQMGQERYREVQSALSKIVPGDYNGDGEIYVDFLDILWLSSYHQQLYEVQGYNFDAQSNSNAKMQFDSEMQNGMNVICLIDAELYEITQEKTQAFATWEELLGYTPENAYDDCAILMEDLSFGRSDGMVLPEGTVLCVRKKGEISLSQSKAERDRFYDFHVQAVKNMIEYRS